LAWLRPTASCSLTEKLQDVNAQSAFNTMFIVLVSQGKSRKSSEKCCSLRGIHNQHGDLDQHGNGDGDGDDQSRNTAPRAL